MIRRKLTLKRVDPWSVLKFGFVVNVALLLVGLLAFGILWFTIRRLGLIDQFCGSVGTIVLDLQECSVNGGNIFRTVLFLGVLGVVVQTGIVVFGAFLYNLIADLTGGLTFSYLDESTDAVAASTRRGQSDEPRQAPTAGASARPPTTARPSPAGASSTAAAPSTARGTPPRPSSDTGAFRPAGDPSSPSGDRTGQDTADDGEADRPRAPRPSGSSLWGDPTRSRE